MKPLFNKNRVETAGRLIADELLLKLLDPNYKSCITERLSEACPAYKAGLTNGEQRVAILRALSLVQLEVAADLAALKTEFEWDYDEEGEVALGRELRAYRRWVAQLSAVELAELDERIARWGAKNLEGVFRPVVKGKGA